MMRFSHCRPRRRRRSFCVPSVVVLFGLLLLSTVVGAQEAPLVGYSAKQVPSGVSYSPVDNYCWILAHSSVRVKDSIWIDGGMAKYLVEIDNKDAAVLDLNGYTLRLDLTQDFDIETPSLTQFKKDPKTDAPVTNRGGIWENGTHVLVQGGHFYEAERYNESAYYKTKDEIPEYEIWAFELEGEKWSRVDFKKDPSNAMVNRSVSGASVCVEGYGVCYYFGGYYSGRTSPDIPSNYSVAQRAMLEYQPASQTIQNNSITGYGQNDDGYQYGTLQHLELGCSSGMLLSLMSERSLISKPNTTSNDIRGEEVSMSTSVMLYDIEKDVWHNQSTEFISDRKPESRTRYCAALLHDTESNSWDLWIYGGQTVADPNKGVQGAYVLTMPAFVWVRITIPQDNVRLRSMTCHAVGSQLLILGGTKPGFEVNQEAPCTGNPSFVNILDMNRVSWESHFTANTTKYVQPPAVRKYAGNATEPISSDGWASDRVKELFHATTTTCNSTSTPRPGSTEDNGGKWSVGRIVGVTLGCVAGVLLLAAFVWLIIHSCKPNAEHAVVADTSGHTTSPTPLQPSQNIQMNEMGAIGGQRSPTPTRVIDRGET